MPATIEDTERIHNRIDELVKLVYESNLTTNNNVNNLAVSVAKIVAAVESWPKPEPRPCSWMKDHLESHKSMRYLWLATILSFVSSALLLVVNLI